MKTEVGSKSPELHIVLSRIGWDLRRFEIDMISQSAVISAMRDDGLWFFARADSVGEKGRGFIEVFRRSDSLGRQDNLRHGSRAPLTPLVNDEFILRYRFPGARSMLRGLCLFLVDNSNKEIAFEEVKQALIASM